MFANTTDNADFEYKEQKNFVYIIFSEPIDFLLASLECKSTNVHLFNNYFLI